MPTLLLILMLSGIVWGQDIVLKATFQGNCSSYAVSFYTYPKVDINDDGIPEIPAGYNYQPYGFYLDTSTFQRFYPPRFWPFAYPQNNLEPYVAVMRRPGLAEWVVFNNYWQIYDMATNDLLASVNVGSCLYVFDYDQDGLDDVISIPYSGEVSVYGVVTGNSPIFPPQQLDIQQVGEDYVISWNATPSATAYRIEWSSALDGGVRFTRIGYTIGTTFTHRNQVGQAMGFYRVLSEDNGTGVVRTVGVSGMSSEHK